MKIPFTVQQFFDVFRNYNETVFPLQFMIYLTGVIAVYLTIRPSLNSNRMISSILVFLWLWMGVVYHLLFFTEINKAAYLFGTTFIIQGILFLIFGVFQNKLSFKFHPDVFGI